MVASSSSSSSSLVGKKMTVKEDEIKSGKLSAKERQSIDRYFFLVCFVFFDDGWMGRGGVWGV